MNKLRIMGPTSCAKAPYSMTSETYKMKNVLVISLICQSPVQHNPVGSVRECQTRLCLQICQQKGKGSGKKTNTIVYDLILMCIERLFLLYYIVK